MNLKKTILAIAAGIAGALLLFVVACSLVYTPVYMMRYFLWRTSDIRDYEKFPYREVRNEAPVFMFEASPREDEVRAVFREAEYEWKGDRKQVGDLDNFLSENGTTAFLVIKDDAILYEKYFNGYQRDSINTSFSMAKSFTSALVGAAIADGVIGDVDDPFVEYIPELRGRGFDAVTLRHLLMMSSGIRYSESKLGDVDFPWGSDPLTYYFPDLRKAALDIRKEGEPAKHFHYNNYHPLLLGMVLERTTGKSVAAYLEEKIWRPLGMEFPASWSIDSERSGFEKMESGINARSIDFAKFGRLFLHGGRWNEQRILPEDWVIESTSPPAHVPEGYYSRYTNGSFVKGLFFASRGGYYKYMWWGYAKEGGAYDYFADGHLGQFIYICPERNLIIVRNGMREGQVDWWPQIFRDVCQRWGEAT